MRKHRTTLLLVIFAVVITATAASHYVRSAYYRAYPAGKRVSDFSEGVRDGTNEPVALLRVADYIGGLHVGPCGLSQAVNWGYAISLSGAGERFPFEQVELHPESLGGQERLVDGEVQLDRKAGLVTISLKVARGKGMEDFVGNGTFALTRQP
jgi:hypothetical protein